jgi:hypothetical protein
MFIVAFKNLYFAIVNINTGMFMRSPVRRSENIRKGGPSKKYRKV